MPRPIPISHARRRTIAASAVSGSKIRSAQRKKPPRHGAASYGGQSTSRRWQSRLDGGEAALGPPSDAPAPDSGGPHPPPVRAVGIAEADDRGVAVAHALRFPPPG